MVASNLKELTKSRTNLLMKFWPRSDTMISGLPNRQNISAYKICAMTELYCDLSGMPSHRPVNTQTTKIMYLCFSVVVVNGPSMSM